MNGRINRRWTAWLASIAVLLVVHMTGGGEKPKQFPFRYVGGTLGPSDSCKGDLETSLTGLTFRCPTIAITVPYTSIILMQYRADLSRKVRKMKLRWHLQPPRGGGTENRYFALIYNESGGRQGLVLEVSPRAMRPYLAEIDLRAGRRIEVQSHETHQYR